jgi:alanyl-tRNA synthetase
MTSQELRQKYLDFFKARDHQEITPAKLVLQDDPTTLFTSSGMQPLVPFLLGEKHSEGDKLVDSQPSFRAEDMDEVGDNRHTTFFEMLGNWGLGSYFKKEQLPWIWEFLTKEVGLQEDKLHVSVFEGNDFVPKDTESRDIWRSLGVSEEHIHEYGVNKNWWSRSGTPDKMPVGEIGGPDSEIFYDFGIERGFHEQSEWKDEECHPNCDCGRFMEIGNSVFIQYKKVGDGQFEELAQRNVDFGGGLERMVAASENEPDIYMTSFFKPIFDRMENEITGPVNNSSERLKSTRVVIDHVRAASFLIVNGVVPANKLQGYVLRRLLRRAAVKLIQLGGGSGQHLNWMAEVAWSVMEQYNETNYFTKDSRKLVENIISEEMSKFSKTMDKGLKEVEKIEQIDAKKAFDLYQTFGFPIEITAELFQQKGQQIDMSAFQAEFDSHKELSRTASAGMFAGGLAGHSDIEVKYHTATHLLHQALRDVLGQTVFQKGSNITPERLRFDFSFDRKVTPEELQKVEEIINNKIKADLKVERSYMTYDEAMAKNAIGLFGDKYDKTKVSIYAMGPNDPMDPESKDQRARGGYYSLEFCGGPHVEHTNQVGGIKLVKEEAVSAGVRRIRAELI